MIGRSSAPEWADAGWIGDGPSAGGQHHGRLRSEEAVVDRKTVGSTLAEWLLDWTGADIAQR
jgi:hypothetical protein